MRILGIDPGTRVAGYGCLDLPEAGPRPEGGGNFANERAPVGGGRPRLREAGLLRLGPSSLPVPRRLLRLAELLEERIEALRPRVLVVEEAFAGRGLQAALRLGEARGVVLLTAIRAGLEIAQYPPATIKRRVAGNGRSSKEQMARLLAASLEAPPRAMEGMPLDASDALAAALCHALSLGGRVEKVPTPGPGRT